MPHTVFFSWQADTATRVGRNFIERALERAARRIGDDTNIEEAIRDLSIDRDTKDVPGSPPIVDTIFQKIDKAAVFVPDLTFVGRRLDGRSMPNPNVLIEYGWALKALGHGRIVPVMNTAFGLPTPDAMPFNLRHLRNPILYHCPADASDEIRSRVSKELAGELERGIRIVFASEEFRASLPAVPAPSEFAARSSIDASPGRFRLHHQPIGMNDLSQQDVYLHEHPVIWLRLMPKVDPGRTWLVTEIIKLAKSGSFYVLPFNNSWSGYSHLRARDGFGVFAHLKENPEFTPAVVFIFTTGEIWSLDAYLLNAIVEHGDYAIPDVQDLFTTSLVSYGRFLTGLGIAPPFKWVAGMENLENRFLYTPQRWSRRGPKCLQEVVIAGGTYSPGDDPRMSLRPFFAALFDACGQEWPS